jgi:hypothetical protein
MGVQVFRSMPWPHGAMQPIIFVGKVLTSLTMRQILPFSGTTCARFRHGKTHRPGSVTQWVHFGEQRQQVIGKNFQEVYFSQFLAKPGAERAQLGVFGHSGAIGAIYFSL